MSPDMNVLLIICTVYIYNKLIELNFSVVALYYVYVTYMIVPVTAEKSIL